jgi:hypothetical protein
MFDAHSLTDLDGLGPAALKALIVAQQEQYHAALRSQATAIEQKSGEIEHLKLLVEKLKRMLFGRSSEKVQQQIEQLELRLEELETSTCEHVRSNSRTSPATDSAPASCGRALPDLCRAKFRCTCPSTMLVQSAAVNCDGWAKTCPRCWNGSRRPIR